MYYYIYVKKYGLEQPDIAGFDNMYKYGSNWRISKEREYGIKKEACFTVMFFPRWSKHAEDLLACEDRLGGAI